jgi:peptidoglycan hydrolase FlgJ
MLSPAQTAALKEAAASSVSCEQTTKLPAELMLAQWALESDWGKHQPGNNCFGIKAFNGCFGVQSLETFEIVSGVRRSVSQNFATFPCLEACFHKHADLLTGGKPYRSAWAQYLKTKDLQTLICQIAPIYATDPNYSKLLSQLIVMPEVKAALESSRRDLAQPPHENDTLAA